MAVTLKELASACGMSVSTVSKALNGYSDVSEATREQVRATAARLGYRPNTIARSLKMGRTYNIGVVYEDNTESGFTHNYFSPILQAFKQEIERHGYDLTFITHRGGSVSPMTYLEHCMARSVDGVCVVCCMDFQSPQILQLLSDSLPTVTIDRPHPNSVCIRSNNNDGMDALVKYVLQLGHRRVAYVHGETFLVTDARIEAYKRQLKAFGIPFRPEYLVESPYHDPSAAKLVVAGLLALPEPPTCILMPDDYASLGGMEAIREAGLKVPEDISIAGYDGVRLLQLCSPSLTTYRQNVEEIGLEAGVRLLQMIEHPEEPHPSTITIPGELVKGDTVADLTRT